MHLATTIKIWYIGGDQKILKFGRGFHAQHSVCLRNGQELYAQKF